MDSSLSQLLTYWQVLVRRRKMFMLAAMGITAILVVVIYSLPKKYKADSTVFIEKNVINNLVQGLAITPDADERIRVLHYAMTSRTLLEKVVQSLEPELLPKAGYDKQAFISDLVRRTEVSVRNGNLFTVSIVDTNPFFARDYVNTLVNKYLEENLSLNRDETYGANRFLDEQVALFKRKLDKAEDAIIQFRKQQGIYAGADEAAVLEEIKGLKDKLDKVGLDISSMRARRQQVLKELAHVPAKISVYSERQASRQDEIVTRLRQLQAIYTENYPEVVRLRAELKALKRQGGGKDSGTVSSLTAINPVYKDLSQKKVDIESDLGALEDNQKHLQKMLESREKELREIPENKKQLTRLVQERDSLRKVYEQLLGRVGQAEVSKQMEIGNKTTTYRVVDPALLPHKPISPDIKKLLLLVLAAGIAGGYAIIYLLDSLSPAVRSLADVDSLGLPVIGIIPRITVDAAPKGVSLLDRLVYSGAVCFYTAYLTLWGYEFLK